MTTQTTSHPMPRDRNRSAKGAARSAFKTLEVGASTLIPCDPVDDPKQFYGRVRTHVSRYGKQMDMKFITKPEGNDVRVWRSE